MPQLPIGLRAPSDTASGHRGPSRAPNGGHRKPLVFVGRFSPVLERKVRYSCVVRLGAWVSTSYSETSAHQTTGPVRL